MEEVVSTKCQTSQLTDAFITFALDEWVPALRDGQFDQGMGRLKRQIRHQKKPAYCCLGVLCELTYGLDDEKHWGPDSDYTATWVTASTGASKAAVLSKDLTDKYGISKTGKLPGGEPFGYSDLSVANDAGVQFSEIAAYIEGYVQTVRRFRQTEVVSAMDVPFMRNWITALRSGEYPQAKKRLKTENGYCCLGVACEVAGLSFDNVNGGYRIADQNGAVFRSFAPGSVVALFDGSGTGGFWNLHPLNSLSLATVNDSGGTFDEIAAYLEGMTDATVQLRKEQQDEVLVNPGV